jgi:hypothetical protein
MPRAAVQPMGCVLVFAGWIKVATRLFREYGIETECNCSKQNRATLSSPLLAAREVNITIELR